MNITILPVFIGDLLRAHMNLGSTENRIVVGKRYGRILLVILYCVVAVSCTVAERKPLSILDTSQHHTYTGIVMMKQGKYRDARREFDLSLELNNKEAKSYAGIALITAYEGEYKSAFEYMAKAEQYARKKEEKLFVYIGKLRLYTMSREGEDWISKARSQFESACAINSRASAAYYFMGLAFKMNFEFSNAGAMFVKVLDLNDEYVEEADREWKLIKKILSVEPLTLTGKKIAIADTATRAEVAALLIEELQLDELYRRLGIHTSETLAAQTHSKAVPYPYQGDVEKILQIGVKGLELYPDGEFHPQDLVTRAILAVVIVDVMEKITKNVSLAQSYEAMASPYKNLSRDLPYYGEIMTVLSMGIMDVRTLTSSRLAPYEPLSGIDAIVALHELKDVLINL